MPPAVAPSAIRRLVLGPAALACAAGCATPGSVVTSEAPRDRGASIVVGLPTLVAPDTISTARTEVRLAVSSDGTRELWGTIGWEGGPGGFDIWERRRIADGGWDAPRPTTFDTEANEFDPAFAPDGSGVYFFSNRAGGAGGDDLWFAPLDAGTGEFGAAVNLGRGVNSAGDEWAPTLSPDGRRLLFATDGRGGRGGHDLFVATRAADGRWSSPEPLDAVNGAQDDFDATFLHDRRSIVFARGNADSGRADLHLSVVGPNGRLAAPVRLGASVNVSGGLNLGPSIVVTEPGILYFSSHRGEARRGRLDVYRVAYRLPRHEDD